MADIFSIDMRSNIMRQVKSRNNKSTEIKLIEIFKNQSLNGWRRKYKLFGNPDFVFPKQKIALFVDGCFWHGHYCRKHTPKSNELYWTNKIKRNQNRDSEVGLKLSQMGWKVIRIWECELNNNDCVGKLLNKINDGI